MSDDDLPQSGGEGAPRRQTFIVVHGVGRQAELDTLRTLVEGYHMVYEKPRAAGISRAETGQIQEADDADWFKEVHYADSITHHEEYGERDLRRWLRSFQGRLKEIHEKRGGGTRPDFSGIERATDDILFTTTIAKLIAERLKVSTVSFESSANGFLRQLQLFADLPSYRDEIIAKVGKRLAEIAAAAPKRRLVLAAHSLGTVVTLIALLRAEAAGEVWVGQIDRFVTFGSPLDLVMVLFPEFFPSLPGPAKRAIQWTNYTLWNDPIATDLRVIREWFLPAKAAGLFAPGAPLEVVLGSGSLYTAHTDYWHEMRMLWDLFGRSTEAAGNPLPDRPGGMSGVAWLAWAAVLVSSWVTLIWWDENVKLNNAERVAVLSRGLVQVVLWALAAGLIACHAACWSRSSTTRVMCFVGTIFLAGFLYLLLPPLAILGQPSPPVKVDETVSRPIRDLLPTSVVDAVNHLISTANANREQLTGNIILVLVPFTAMFGAFRVVNRISKKTLVLALIVLTVFLSLGVGTRTNPSNVTQEFGTLFFVFTFWILAILLFRIDRVYHEHVRGRQHIDILHNLWNRPTS